MTRRMLAGRFLLVGLLAGLAVSPTWAADEAKPAATTPAEGKSKFMRLERDGQGEPIALQTAVTRFVSTDPTKSDLVVDLIGAVHVGEKAYYDALNKQFENYDVVLYELVAPPGTRIPKGTKPGNHPIAMLQNGLKNMLQLEHQLEHIDYTKANMLHADMSPDDFSKSMESRGESFFTMFFRMMGQAMAQQSQQANKGRGSEFELFAALFDRDRAGALKRLMAEQFENIGGAMDALDGPQGSTIISERNKVALKTLAEQIAAGKKKIAIFYGAGHMNGMEKQLLADFHLRRSNESWLTAWSLAKPAPARQAPARKPAAGVSPRRPLFARASVLASAD